MTNEEHLIEAVLGEVPPTSPVKLPAHDRMRQIRQEKALRRDGVAELTAKPAHKGVPAEESTTNILPDES